MAQQMLLNESTWNQTLKSNKMKLVNNKRQSIKLKIELPTYSDLDTEEKTPSLDSDDEQDYQNATIRLEISFDTRQTPKRFKKNEFSSARKVCLNNKKAASLTTSGYSSSNSSVVNYIQDRSFYAEENIYDKLDYKRRSLASTNSSMSSASSKEDYYEEISNFSQMKSSYENNSAKTYKREYTLNEIFQNLKSFKTEAKQQELLNTTYTDLKPPKSVNFLKQIFESKSKKSPVTLSPKAIKQVETTKDNTKLIKPTIQHVYVNEKILRPINV